MTKRAHNKYEKNPRGLYETPPKAVSKLLPYIQDVRVFAEPMCASGQIVRYLESLGWLCGMANDLVPSGPMMARATEYDVFDLRPKDFGNCGAIISNPPWPTAGGVPGDPAVSIIIHLMKMRLPAWLLLAADFSHNEYAAPLLRNCRKIVSAYRVSFMNNDKGGFDNAAWHLFDANFEGHPTFHGYDNPTPDYHPEIASVL